MVSAKIIVALCLVAVCFVAPSEAVPAPLKFPGCNCFVVPVFAPVCAANGVTYYNEGELACTNTCNGTLITIIHKGTCTGGQKGVNVVPAAVYPQPVYPAVYPPAYPTAYPPVYQPLVYV